MKFIIRCCSLCEGRKSVSEFTSQPTNDSTTWTKTFPQSEMKKREVWGMKWCRGDGKRHVNLITRHVVMLCGFLNILESVKLRFSLVSLIGVWKTSTMRISLTYGSLKWHKLKVYWESKAQSSPSGFEIIKKKVKNWLKFIYLMAKLIRSRGRKFVYET